MTDVGLLAANASGGLRGTLTVIGTLALVAACFVVVELLDRRATHGASGPDSPRRSPAADLGRGDERPVDDVWPLRTSPRPRPTPTRTLAVAGGGLVATVVVAAALAPFREQFGQATAALSLVLVIIVAAGLGGRAAAAVTSAGAALAFNFFHAPPVHTFHIADTSAVVTSVLMIVVGVAVGELAARRTGPVSDRVDGDPR